jgi:hypothetical protein
MPLVDVRQVRAENLFKIAQQQLVAIASFEGRSTTSASDHLEAAVLHGHVAMIYEALREAYPAWGQLWCRWAGKHYEAAGRHEVAAYVSERPSLAA